MIPIITAFAPILWGTTYAVTTELLRGFDPFTVATLRALPIGLVMVVAGRRLPEGIWWWRAFVLGALNIGLFFGLLFVAAYRLPGGIAATIGAVQPLMVMVLAWPLLKQKPTVPGIVMAAVGVVGVGLLVLERSVSFDAPGLAAAIGAAGVMAVGVVLTRRWGRPVPLPVFTGWQLTTGGLVVGVIALVVGAPVPALTTANIGGLLWLGVLNTGVGYILWFFGVERLKNASQASSLALLSPVVAVVVGWILLRQSLSGTQILGALLVFGSVFAVQRTRAQAEDRRPAE